MPVRVRNKFGMTLLNISLTTQQHASGSIDRKARMLQLRAGKILTNKCEKNTCSVINLFASKKRRN